MQTTWELPIVIQYPESTVHFEFCSNPGDISFGIIFVASPEEGQDINDLEIETVQEMDIVRSNLESVSGSFEVPCEGVLFFMWDNNFDWSATKQISYLIEVSQVCYIISCYIYILSRGAFFHCQLSMQYKSYSLPSSMRTCCAWTNAYRC